MGESTSGLASEPIGVVLIDDHLMVADALSAALQIRGLVVLGTAATLADGLTLVAASNPDVVLLDARLPDSDGPDGVRRLIAANPDAAVVVMSGVADPRTGADVFTAGAMGYVSKDAPIALLERTIREAADGQMSGAERHTAAILARLRARESAGRGYLLTPREREAIHLLADGSGVSGAAEAMGISRNTARKHIQSVLDKLGAHSQLEAAAIARREGILDRDWGRP